MLYPTLPHLSYTPMIRSLQKPSQAIGSDRLWKHIQYYLDQALISGESFSKKLKARAVGSTAAISAGANINDFLTHGNWASSSIFDTFYRLTRAIHNDFTNTTLLYVPLTIYPVFRARVSNL